MRLVPIPLGLLLLIACRSPDAPDSKPADPPGSRPAAKKTKTPEKTKPKKPKDESRSVPMPSGFAVKGTPKVDAAYLGAEAAWRQLASRVTQLQAEAVSRGDDICVTFESDRMHATTRMGSRHTWRLPAGLPLAGVPVHLLLMADYSIKLVKADLSQVPLLAEVTIVIATLPKGGGTFRLVVKGQRAIRSISTSG